MFFLMQNIFIVPAMQHGIAWLPCKTSIGGWQVSCDNLPRRTVLEARSPNLAKLCFTVCRTGHKVALSERSSSGCPQASKWRLVGFFCAKFIWPYIGYPHHCTLCKACWDGLQVSAGSCLKWLWKKQFIFFSLLDISSFTGVWPLPRHSGLWASSSLE